MLKTPIGIGRVEIIDQQRLLSTLLHDPQRIMTASHLLHGRSRPLEHGVAVPARLITRFDAPDIILGIVHALQAHLRFGMPHMRAQRVRLHQTASAPTALHAALCNTMHERRMQRSCTLLAQIAAASRAWPPPLPHCALCTACDCALPVGMPRRQAAAAAVHGLARLDPACRRLSIRAAQPRCHIWAALRQHDGGGGCQAR